MLTQEQEAYKTLLQNIVDKHLPDESIVFTLESDEMVTALFAQKWEGHQDGHSDKYGVADLASVKPVLDIVLVALSTFKVFGELRKLRQSKEIDVESLKQQWEQRLKDEGIKSAKAKAIAKDFAGELIALTGK